MDYLAAIIRVKTITLGHGLGRRAMDLVKILYRGQFEWICIDVGQVCVGQKVDVLELKRNRKKGIPTMYHVLKG